jgi:hypothetical protein
MLGDDQRKVLEALTSPNATVADRTEAALQDRTGIAHVGSVLLELEVFDPPLVKSDVDATLGTQVWQATLAAGDLVDSEP